jgi:hypothetical protein
MRSVHWLVPGINFAVRRERVIPRRGGRVDHEVGELVSLTQAGREED